MSIRDAEIVNLDADGLLPIPAAPWLPDVGDAVWVVFWRPTGTHYSPTAGVWDTTHGRVVSVGRTKIWYELGNPDLPPHFGGDGIHGSPLRLVTPDWVFADRDAATEATKTMPPPAP